MPLLPRGVQAVCKPTIKMPPWFDQEFVRRSNLRERMLGAPEGFGFRLPSRRNMFAGLSSVVRGFPRYNIREFRCIEMSHPYMHRPLVEFLLAIPLDQKLRPGESRSLMRRALRDILPEKIAKRRGKRGPDEAISRALAREWPSLRQLFSDARVCSRGYMRPHKLLSALDRARHGAEKQTFALLNTISLEFWLRSLENWGSAAKSVALPREATERATAAQFAHSP